MGGSGLGAVDRVLDAGAMAETHGSGGEACTRAAGPSEQSTRTTASCGEWTASGDNTKTEGVVQVVAARSLACLP